MKIFQFLIIVTLLALGGFILTVILLNVKSFGGLIVLGIFAALTVLSTYLVYRIFH